MVVVAPRGQGNLPNPTLFLAGRVSDETGATVSVIQTFDSIFRTTFSGFGLAAGCELFVKEGNS